jgi:hypothetical protein
MTPLDWQLVVALLCVALAGCSLLRRIGRLLFPSRSGKSAVGGCGACSQCPSAAAPAAPADAAFVSLAALRATGEKR